MTDEPKWKFVPTAPTADALAEATPMENPTEFVMSSEPLVYYKEPERTYPTPAGVAPGYLVLRSHWFGARVANCAMLHDGEGRFVVDVDEDTWQDAEIVDNSPEA